MKQFLAAFLAVVLAANPVFAANANVQADDTTGVLWRPTAFSKYLVPSQTGNNGKFLTTNGTVTSWATISSNGTGNVTGASLTANAIVTGNGTTSIKVSGITVDASDNIVTTGNITANIITANVSASTGTITTANVTNLAGATANGQLLIGNATSGNFVKSVLTQGANVTITNAAGGITIAASGNVGAASSMTANYLTYATGSGTIATAPNLYLYGDALKQDVSNGHSYIMIRTLGAGYSSWLDLTTTTNSFQLANDGTKLGISNGFTHAEFTGNSSSTAYTKFLSDKASTSTSTGAVVIGTSGSTAGLGVLGNINAGGTITGAAIVGNTINGLTVTTSNGTLTIANSKTLTVSSNTTLNGASSTGLPDVWVIPIGDETTAITTGTAKVTFRAPYAATVTAVRASLNTVSSSGTPTFDINEAGTSILSTKLTIDANELTSTTAATAAVISDTALADDAEMTIDIDTAGTGAKGAKIAIYVVR